MAGPRVFDERDDERDAINDRVAAALEIVPAEIAVRDLDIARDHVQETILQLDDQLLEIRADIAHAKDRLTDTGVAADPHWWRRANLAVLYKTRARQRLQFILSGISRRLKDISNRTADSNKDKFIDAARDMLPDETYQAIWRAVRTGGD